MPRLGAHRLRTIDQPTRPDAFAAGGLVVEQPKPLRRSIAPWACEPRPEADRKCPDRVSAKPRVQRPTGGPAARLASFPARRARDGLRPDCGPGRAHRFYHRSQSGVAVIRRQLV